MKKYYLWFLKLTLCLFCFSVHADSQTMSLWQIKPSSAAELAQLKSDLKLPQNSTSSIALSLQPKLIKQLALAQIVKISLPQQYEKLQLTVTKVLNNDDSTIVHASDNGQRLIITSNGEHTFATVITNQATWSITGSGQNALMYQSTDPRQTLSIHGHNANETDYLLAPEQAAPLQKTKDDSQVKADVNSNTVAVVDAYIIYSDAAELLYGGSAGTLTRINHMVAVTNDIYMASNVKIQLNALRIDRVVYNQTDDSITALNKITGISSNEQFFSHERQVRDAIGADVMILLRPYVNDGICGMAWINSSFYNNRYMVSHTSIDCSDEVNAHELGHNMGLGHSRKQGETGATYPFALGHGVDNSFATVMAYPSAFSGVYGRVFKFSSPDLDCNGLPCGVDRNDAVNGADAVYALNQKRFDIAGLAERGPSSGSINVQVSGVASAIISSNSGHGGTAPYTRNEIALGTEVSLTAPAYANGVPFVAWLGCDSVADLQCNTVIRGDLQVSAIFSEEAGNFSDVVEAPELVFISSGDKPWQVDFTTAAAGQTSLRSGAINDRQQSSVETTLNGAGILSFSWKVSSEQSYDHMRLYVNGSRYADISGDVNWYQTSVTLGQGTHQVRWTYEKDNSQSSGADAGWLDDVSWDVAAPVLVQVNKAGSGLGSVSILPYPDQCNDNCANLLVEVEANSWIAISATPNQYSEFAGWTGACVGQGYFCQLYATENIITTAIFNMIPVSDVELQVLLSGSGAGKVQLTNLPECIDVNCQYTIPTGTPLTLTPVAQANSSFDGWSGDCSGLGLCYLTMSASTYANAQFSLKQYELSSTATDGGEISVAPNVVVHGQQAIFELSPAAKYKVNRTVTGTCPAGEWLNATTYRTGVATAACSVNFSFSKVKRRKLPFWLFGQD